MISHAALTLANAAAEAGAETSKTPFYVAGGVLTLFAVLVAALGIVRHDFPASRGALGAVMAIGLALVAATMVTSVLTG